MQQMERRFRPCVRVVDAEQGAAEVPGGGSENQAGQKDQHLAAEEDSVHPLRLAGTVVLTGERQVGLVEGIHGRVDKAFDIGGRRVAGHDGRSERIDGGLDQDIRDGEDAALQSGRKTDLQDRDQPSRDDPDLSQVQVNRTVLKHQTADRQDHGKCL